MDQQRGEQLTAALIKGADALLSIAKTAARNRKSIATTGFYAERFHRAVIDLTRVERALMPVIAAIDGLDTTGLRGHLEVVKATTGAMTAREQSRRQIKLIAETEVVPRLGSISAPAVPTAEPVLPAAVLGRAPNYLHRTLLQANGCYVSRYYEASSVMIRKLVENLIIDVYEHHRFEAEIKGPSGEYLMLEGLVAAILNQTHWQLQRETKRSLPEIKRLGDRAAHNRRYRATKQDIDQVLPGLRAAVDDLLHLAGHK